jgi:hypothetical protein
MPDFEKLRRLYEVGNESALHQAANACRHPNAEWVKLPSWVLEAPVRHNIEYMRALAPGKGKGSTAGWGKRHRKDLVHLARYAAVCRALDENPGNNSRAYERALAALENSPWLDGASTPAAIRKSYKLVQREREKDLEQFRRRFWFGGPGWMLEKN